jgi:hypothetical protein
VDVPKTTYATSKDDVGLAYQAFGSGTVDFVFDPAPHGDVEVWE